MCTDLAGLRKCLDLLQVYCDSVNIPTNVLFLSWQVYGNNISVYVNVLIIIRNLLP